LIEHSIEPKEREDASMTIFEALQQREPEYSTLEECVTETANIYEAPSSDENGAGEEQSFYRAEPDAAHSGLLTVKEVAAETGLKERAVQRKLQTGRIQGVKQRDQNGTIRWYVTVEKLEKFMLEELLQESDEDNQDEHGMPSGSVNENSRSSTENKADEVISDIANLVENRLKRHHDVMVDLKEVIYRQEKRIDNLTKSLNEYEVKCLERDSTISSLRQHVQKLESKSDLMIQEIAEIRDSQKMESRPWWKKISSQ
jgi:hypothetical protein